MNSMDKLEKLGMLLIEIIFVTIVIFTKNRVLGLSNRFIQNIF